MSKLASLENIESSELAQKAKVKWSIEGDENSKKFHGIINKRRNNLAIRGIMVDGDWMEDPFSHCQNRFEAPCATRLFMDMEFPNRLSSDQALDLERHFSKE
uniref:RNA-directed DNA polymerase, eukaryota n=1 Tax=Tanacetum cinerariifolium TaxID=118510 RepID=A0A6L2LLQ2_TANCI|nr:RNA-directed DNA polymerase, eukaryota [Tanacetum cinerariifolium]